MINSPIIPQDALEATIAIAEARDLDSILRVALEKAVRVTGATQGWIKLLALGDSHPALREILESQVHYGYGADHTRYTLKPGKGICGLVVAMGEPLVEGDIQLYLKQHPEITDADHLAQTRSILVIPLKVRSKTIGVLNLESSEVGAFSSEHLKVVSIFASHAALALRDAIVSRLDRLATTSIELKDFLELLLDVALLLTNARHGTLRFVNKDKGWLELKAHRGDGKIPPARLKIGPHGTIVGQVAFTKNPLCISDVTRAPWKDHYSPITRLRIRSELAVPLLTPDHEVEGVLNVESVDPDNFSSECQELLEDIAVQAMSAIKRARLPLAMYEISLAMAQWDEEELFQVIVHQARDLLNAPVCALWTTDPTDPQRLVLRAGLSHPGIYDRKLGTLPIQGLVAEAMEHKKAVVSLDVQNDPGFQRRDLARREGWRSVLIAPLSIRDQKPLGVLIIRSVNNVRDFQLSEQDLLTALGRTAAIAIRNSELRQQLVQEQERDSIVEMLGIYGFLSTNTLHRLGNQLGEIGERINQLRDELKSDRVTGGEWLDDLRRRTEAANTAITEWAERLDADDLSLKAISLLDCINGALKDVRIPSGIRVQVPSDDLMVQASPMLRHVFTNLFQNAIEAMGDRGKLRVSAKVKDRSVEVKVSDTGRGIPAKLLKKIFEKGATTKKGPNHGIGLWLARKLIYLLGGDIQVESAIDKGTTFVVSLRAAGEDISKLNNRKRLESKPDLERASPLDPRLRSKSTNGLDVLVVEDIRFWYDRLSQILSAEGYAPTIVTTFSEAQSELQRRAWEFDAAIVDFELAGVPKNRDGYLLLDDLKRENIPVVVVSGLPRPDLIREATAQFDVTDCLSKVNFDQRKLLAALKSALITRIRDEKWRSLSPLEWRIVKAMVQGNVTDGQLAENLHIKKYLVRDHVSKILKKLKKSARAAIVPDFMLARGSWTNLS